MNFVFREVLFVDFRELQSLVEVMEKAHFGRALQSGSPSPPSVSILQAGAGNGNKNRTGQKCSNLTVEEKFFKFA